MDKPEPFPKQGRLHQCRGFPHLPKRPPCHKQKSGRTAIAVPTHEAIEVSIPYSCFFFKKIHANFLFPARFLLEMPRREIPYFPVELAVLSPTS
jgi:hypothetical protein